MTTASIPAVSTLVTFNGGTGLVCFRSAFRVTPHFSTGLPLGNGQCIQILEFHDVPIGRWLIYIVILDIFDTGEQYTLCQWRDVTSAIEALTLHRFTFGSFPETCKGFMHKQILEINEDPWFAHRRQSGQMEFMS